MSNYQACDDWQWNADIDRDCEVYLSESTVNAAIPANTEMLETVAAPLHQSLENNDINVISLSSIEKSSGGELSPIHGVSRGTVEEEMSDSDYVEIVSNNHRQKDETEDHHRKGYTENRKSKDNSKGRKLHSSPTATNSLPDVIPATQLASCSSQTGTQKLPNLPEERHETITSIIPSPLYDDFAPDEVLQIKSTYDEHYSGEGNSGYGTNFNESLMEDTVSVKEGIFLDEGMDSFDSGVGGSGSGPSITTLPKLFRGSNVFLDIPESVRNAYATIGIQKPYDWQVRRYSYIDHHYIHNCNI